MHNFRHELRANRLEPSVEHYRGTSKRIISMENNTLSEMRGVIS
jgi:hypothetical protein